MSSAHSTISINLFIRYSLNVRHWSNQLWMSLSLTSCHQCTHCIKCISHVSSTSTYIHVYIQHISVVFACPHTLFVLQITGLNNILQVCGIGLLQDGSTRNGTGASPYFLIWPLEAQNIKGHDKHDGVQQQQQKHVTTMRAVKAKCGDHHLRLYALFILYRSLWVGSCYLWLAPNYKSTRVGGFNEDKQCIIGFYGWQ